MKNKQELKINHGLPVHYRYNDFAHEEGVEIKLLKFYPVRETKCCYFVISEMFYIEEKDFIYPNARVRRVTKNALRGHCHPSKHQALYSFKKRKESQAGHAQFSLSKAEQCLIALKDLDGGVLNTPASEDMCFDKMFAGRPDYWDNLNFE